MDVSPRTLSATYVFRAELQHSDHDRGDGRSSQMGLTPTASNAQRLCRQLSKAVAVGPLPHFDSPESEAAWQGGPLAVAFDVEVTR